jgi:chitin disaccharide deacetylase
VSELLDRLGLPASTRAAIITCLDLGQSHATNVGIFEVLKAGGATSASLMVPCPWAREAATRYSGEDVGVQLTLNSEHRFYRWGPITHAPSLVDGNGGFPETLPDLWDHADLDEVRRECRAQIERALSWGFDVSHLNSHWDALSLRPEFFDTLLDVALEFRLPTHLPGGIEEANAGFRFRTLAREEGVVFPDAMVDLDRMGPRTLADALETLEPGVTEVRLGPAIDTPELRAITEDWSGMVEQHRELTASDITTVIGRSGVVLVSFRSLRELQRND